MNRVFLMVKVCGKEHHRDAFLEGHLHMNTLSYFRKYEESATGNIGDRHEATVALLQPGQSTITLVHDDLPGGEYTIPAEDLAGPSVIQHNAHDPMNVLCLYAAHERGLSPSLEEDFEAFVMAQMMRPEVDGLGEYAALIFDTKAFQQRVLDAIRAGNFRAVAGLVDYYDPATFNGTFDHVQAVLKKRAEFAHQREYRFAVERDVLEEKPFTLDVGSLRDIALSCRVSEVNQLIRDILYQWRSQGVFEQHKK